MGSPSNRTKRLFVGFFIFVPNIKVLDFDRILAEDVIINHIWIFFKPIHYLEQFQKVKNES